jgi:hypothetical protein
MVDLSPVFEPTPTISFVGSSKYMPLTTMPSQLSPLPSYVSTLVYRPVSVSGSDSASNSGLVNSSKLKTHTSELPSTDMNLGQAHCLAFRVPTLDF